MLTTIRKNQKGLLIIVTIAICAAFGWFFTKADTTTGQHVPTLVVGDAKLKVSQYRRISNQQMIAAHLQLPGSEIISPLVNMLGQTHGESLGDGVYPATIQLVRNEAKRLGIAVSDDEVTEIIRNTPAFQTNGQFDESRFLAYEGGDPSQPSEGIYIVQQTPYGPVPGERPVTLSRSGLTAADIKQVVRDFRSAQKIFETLGAGVQTPEWRATQRYELLNQIITADILAFTDAQFESEVDTSDEAIAAYYEENKDRFMNQPRLVVQYVSFDHKPTPAAENETEEQAAARAKADNAAKIAMRRKADELYEAIRTGSSFELAAASFEVSPTLSEPFDVFNAPAALRPAQRQLLEVQSKDAPVMFVNGDHSSVVLLVKDFLAAQPKPLESIRDEVKAALVNANSANLAEVAANEAQTKLAELANGGTSLAALKSSANITNGTLTEGRQVALTAEASAADRTLFAELSSLNVGELSTVIPTADGFQIALITKREIERSETREEEIASLASRLALEATNNIQSEWWTEAIINANPHVE
ncbi:peptidylprolyl isomerase [Sulfuriroseicoccus oceanibius]|uniref:SurA N-terminal domain-containing protein n=1 Tax=Sulfuriroseicoccus oceanibius TaxID=2707525 RepID=A0A6B3LDC8_9BACT|nr:peptidylprolyl isomerase [Sulfuriroseicoccus oceanibius]QQL44547.1 SurA N-terminal domain-containing protein [Sulfuriroseicoccus oceanibius]